MSEPPPLLMPSTFKFSEFPHNDEDVLLSEEEHDGDLSRSMKLVLVLIQELAVLSLSAPTLLSGKISTLFINNC